MTGGLKIFEEMEVWQDAQSLAADVYAISQDLNIFHSVTKLNERPFPSK